MLNYRIAYCGAGQSGKTANIEYIHAKTSSTMKVIDESHGVRAFDYLPLSVGKVQGHQVQFQLLSVPGHVSYAESRRLILENVDAVVFVVDSQKSRLDANLEALQELQLNLNDRPLVFQYNKRDAVNIFNTEELEQLFNPNGLPYVEAVAIQGLGVLHTVKSIGKLIFDSIKV